MSKLSGEVRYWPYSSKPVGDKLLAEWADKIAALEAVAEAARRLFYPSLESEGIFCAACNTNTLRQDELLHVLIAAGFLEDEWLEDE